MIIVAGGDVGQVDTVDGNADAYHGRCGDDNSAMMAATTSYITVGLAATLGLDVQAVLADNGGEDVYARDDAGKGDDGETDRDDDHGVIDTDGDDDDGCMARMMTTMMMTLVVVILFPATSTTRNVVVAENWPECRNDSPRQAVSDAPTA